MYQITDWDDAYANAPHIPGAEGFAREWASRAAGFRAGARRISLGTEGLLARSDLFLPLDSPRGLVVFIHGGYWMKFDPSFWSHLAAGPLAHGYAVALPAYDLAPQVRISQITRQVSVAVQAAAARIAGPLILTGHSAGGHLAARMVCNDATLPDPVAARVRLCLPISPLADLRPLLRTRMNDNLRLDEAESIAESPALLRPRCDTRLITWVGEQERPEFIRQARILADIWAGLGAATECVIDPGRHHFDIIDALARPDSRLTQQLTAI